MQVLLNFLHGHGVHLIPTPPLPYWFTILGILEILGSHFLNLFPRDRQKGIPTVLEQLTLATMGVYLRQTLRIPTCCKNYMVGFVCNS